MQDAEGDRRCATIDAITLCLGQTAARGYTSSFGQGEVVAEGGEMGGSHGAMQTAQGGIIFTLLGVHARTN